MKLLTLNTYSLIEEGYPEKLQAFVKMIAAEKPDVIALQEVNQSMDAAPVDPEILAGYYPCTDKPIREDNHAYSVTRLLAEEGVEYYWTWLPVKIGYERYDEGLALLSLLPILETDQITVSRTDNYYDWRARKILGIRTDKTPEEWFYSVHYGWWHDYDEPFADQWRKTLAQLKNNADIWLMGDFNSPAEVRGEGYDMVQSSGWRDSYSEALLKDDGITVNKKIAGWEGHVEKIRIDQIWHNHSLPVIRSSVICNGEKYPVVSDHFGVMVEYNEKLKRSAGILLPISSLPSSYGIGCFDSTAYRFVDWLKEAGQSCWQILPLGPTSYGDSPYQSFSAFAGNPYFISLEGLQKEGLLTKAECDRALPKSAADQVDYAAQYHNRYPLLRKAYKNSGKQRSADYEAFCAENDWLEDYALFMALKDKHDGKAWSEWEDDLRFRKPETMTQCKMELAEEIDFYRFLQYRFYKEWTALKAYAGEKGIRIVGDIPIYTAYDSADTWAHPELFQLEPDSTPTAVAGCPPDDFCADGQLWGNPLYRWEKHRETNFHWWTKRLAHCFKVYDVVRIDHFRGFDEYYSIPYGDETARNGHWEKGPGLELFKAIEKALGKRDVIAEDLGFMTDTVRQLVKDCGFPNMKVLEFAFDSRDSDGSGDHLPHNYPENCVAYTGTHDNQTLVSWFKTIKKDERKMARAYLCDQNTPEEQLGDSFISLILRSPAKLCIVPMQDWLGLDDRSRMNIPATVGTNWRWRMEKTALTAKLCKHIRTLTKLFGR